MGAQAEAPGPGGEGGGAAARRPSLLARLKASVSAAREWVKRRALLHHYMELTGQQVAAMLPITLLQVLVLAIFFRKTSPTPGLEALGLLAAVAGLVLFLDGLRVAVMPMAMLVGRQLPKRLALPWVLLVAFFLGVLVTYAEPAIAAIRPLAALVDPASAPYLYYLMNQQQEIMVFAIGAGVGVAAVVGTLKFLYSISLKLLMAATLAPTVACACYMQWCNPHLRPLLGLAWDCGAVTTGPVTVPVLLSLGVGVMQAKREQRVAMAVLEDAVGRNEGQTLEGFGIVTLASLLPILAVELMAIITSAIHPYETILQAAQEAAAAAAGSDGAQDSSEVSPLKEVVYGIRAISPLIVCLVLLVTVVLRQPLPNRGFVPSDEEEVEAGEGAADEAADAEEGGGGAGAGGGKGGKKGDQGDAAERGDVEQAKDTGARRSMTKKSRQPSVTRRGTAGPPGLERAASSVAGGGRTPSVAAAVIAASGAQDLDYYDLTIEGGDDASSDASGHSRGGLLAWARARAAGGKGGGGTGEDVAPRQSCMERVAGAFRRAGALAKEYWQMLAAMAMCQIGMILFNLGLTYGFAALGDATGTTLPAGFVRVDYYPGSPTYIYAGGVVITMLTIFVLGILATKAEPALNVLGETVETLSCGQFTKKMLIWSVCFGVAVGMCAGACKILFELPIIYFIIAKYVVACALTAVARESITAVAWDSAGVTTGPVTVPFVLAIGIGFAKAVGAAEGFGMLTIMSVAPIISVLLTSLCKKPVAKAAEAATQAAGAAAQAAKAGLDRVSRSLYTISRNSRGGDRDGGDEFDFAARLAADPGALAAAGISPAQLEQLQGPRGPPLQQIREGSLVRDPSSITAAHGATAPAPTPAAPRQQAP